MHDIHEANKILQLVFREAKKRHLKKIKKIKLELGEILEHGELLNRENLAYNIKLLAKNTAAEGLMVEIAIGIKGQWKLVVIEGE
jgi:Zn finger protein HypA/HybF involved in hydrogenase expression